MKYLFGSIPIALPFVIFGMMAYMDILSAITASVLFVLVVLIIYNVYLKIKYDLEVVDSNFDKETK